MMKHLLALQILGTLLAAAEAPSAHHYKKRPAAIRAMTDYQIDMQELLEHQARIKYAIMLHRQSLRRLQQEQLTAIRKYEQDDYKAF